MTKGKDLGDQVNIGGGLGDIGAVELLTQRTICAGLHEGGEDGLLEGEGPRAGFGGGFRVAVGLGGVGEGSEKGEGELGELLFDEGEALGLGRALGEVDAGGAHVGEAVLEDTELDGVEGRVGSGLELGMYGAVEGTRLANAETELDHARLDGAEGVANSGGVPNTTKVIDDAEGVFEAPFEVLNQAEGAFPGGGKGGLGIGKGGVNLSEKGFKSRKNILLVNRGKVGEEGEGDQRAGRFRGNTGIGASLAADESGTGGK
jgi:hypothetical protein